MDGVVLASKLTAAGYRVAVREAIGGGSGVAVFSNLRHSFLLVTAHAGSHTGVDFIVEVRHGWRSRRGSCVVVVWWLQLPPSRRWYIACMYCPVVGNNQTGPAAACAGVAGGDSQRQQVLTRAHLQLVLDSTAGLVLWFRWSRPTLVPNPSPSPHPTCHLLQPHFREQFEISHPTPRYSGLLALVPQVMVASAAQLVPLVQLLCAEMSLAFEQHGLSLPPWRQSKSLLSKCVWVWV